MPSSRWLPRERPLAVAALRVAVVGLLLATNEPHDAIEAARVHLPVIAPEGLAWFAAIVPRTAGVLETVDRVYRTAAFLALVGVFTRPALGILLVCAYWLFAAAQLSGAVIHDMHLLWIVAVLCVAHPHHALSVDAWMAHPTASWKRRLLGARRGDATSGLAIAIVRTLLGVVYFFPGFWKIHTSGLAWALSDNLVNQMHAKWLEYGVVPSPRVDRVPTLVHGLGLFALGFELGFLWLVHTGPTARVALAVAGLAFHLGIQRFMLIPFASLWVPYVALVPWRCARRGRRDLAAMARPSAVLAAAGALLVGAAALQGARGQTQAFPFACYPTFARIAPATLPDLLVTALGADGRLTTVPHGRDSRGYRTQREWGTVWSVAGLYGPPYSEERARAYLSAEARRPAVRHALAGARELRLAITELRIDPDEWSAAPVVVRELPPITLDAR